LFEPARQSQVLATLAIREPQKLVGPVATFDGTAPPSGGAAGRGHAPTVDGDLSPSERCALFGASAARRAT
jgi:hypothetical protein